MCSIWHCNEHKTRGDLNSRNMRVCKRFEIGEMMKKCQRQMSKTASSVEPMPGSKPAEDSECENTHDFFNFYF